MSLSRGIESQLHVLRLLFAVFSAVATLSAEEPGITRRDTPDESIIAEHRWQKDSGQEIWLVRKEAREELRLFVTHRHADLLWEDEMDWPVINHNDGSNRSSPLLYRRKAGLRYQEVADLGDAAWAFLRKRTGRKLAYHHTYARALSFLGPPLTILLRLSGHGDERLQLDGYHCIYDVKTGRFSTDLSSVNSGERSGSPLK